MTRLPCVSNCETCNHKKINDNPELHCYMFKTAPEGICAQHTSYLKTFGSLSAAINAINEVLNESQRSIPK